MIKAGFKKLKYKILASVVMSALVPLSVLNFVQYKHFVKEEMIRTKEELKRNATFVEKNIDDWFDFNKRAVMNLAEDSSIKNMGRTRQIDSEKHAVKSFVKTYPWFTVAFTIGGDGKQRVRNDQSDTVDLSKHPSFRKTFRENEPVWVQPAISADIGQPSVSFFAPVYAKKETSIEEPVKVGAAGGRVEMKTLTDIVSNQINKEKEYVYVVNTKGELLLHPVLGKDGKSFNISNKLEFKNAQTEGFFEFVTENGKEMIGYSKKASNDWIVVFAKDKKEMLYVVKELMVEQIIMTLLTLCVVSIAAFYIASWITFNLREIRVSVDEMVKGRDVKLQLEKLKKDDEFGELIDSVNKLNKRGQEKSNQ